MTTALLLTVYTLPVVLIFGALAAIADYLERRHD